MPSKQHVKSKRAEATDVIKAHTRVVIVDCDSDETLSSIEEETNISDSRGCKKLAQQVQSGEGSSSKIPEESRRSKRQAVLAETKASIRYELSQTEDDDFIVDSGKDYRCCALACNVTLQSLL